MIKLTFGFKVLHTHTKKMINVYLVEDETLVRGLYNFENESDVVILSVVY